MEIQINWLAVLVAGVVSMVLGFIYYGPLLGKVWMKEKGYTKEALKKEQSKMGKYYGVSFALSLLTAFVLSHVITLSSNYYNFVPMSAALNSAFWMWLGFVMPVQATAQIFGEKKWKLFGIDTGYQLVSLLGMGVVLALLW